MEVKEWQDVKRVAMNAWQVLGALWGIHTNREQSRICNWFWNVAAGDDPGELFPLKQSDLSGRLEHGQGAQACVHCHMPIEVCQSYKWEDQLVNRTRVDLRWDEDAKTFVGAFPRILTQGKTKEEAIKSLQNIVWMQAYLFRHNKWPPEMKLSAPAAPPEQPQGSEELGPEFNTIPPQYCETHDKVHKCELMLKGDSAGLAERGEGPKCPKCREPLKEVTYPSDCLLNRDQWESQLAGDLYCTCHNNNRGNKPYAYFWKSEFQPADPPAQGQPSSARIGKRIIRPIVSLPDPEPTAPPQRSAREFLRQSRFLGSRVLSPDEIDRMCDFAESFARSQNRR